MAELHRPLECWIGEIHPSELLRWERKGDLPELARRDLRQVIVKRTRPRAEKLWNAKTDVRLSDGWRTVLNSMERAYIEDLPLTDERPLQSWTLSEVKMAMRVPLEQVLKILARLESVYWQPPDICETSPAARVDHESFVTVTDELRERCAAALALTWIESVTREDVRFGYAGETLTTSIEARRDTAAVPASFPRLIDRLLAADRMTAEEELRDVVAVLAHVVTPRSGGEISRQRWTDIFLKRNLSRIGASLPLSDIGDEQGVSRERIRQICDHFERAMLGIAAATPAIDRVLQAASRIAPVPVTDADEQLRRLIGEGAGIEALTAFAVLLGRTNLPARCERVLTKMRGQTVDVTMVQAFETQPWVEAMLRHVSRDSSMFGCTNVLRIAGRMALKEGIAPGQEAIETALEATPGFRWLDQSSGWFSIGEQATCSAAGRVRKIMAVAEESVGTDEITASIASDDLLIYRESASLGLATPPIHVFRELMRGWPWLKVIQKGRFVPSPEFDPAGALSDSEQAISDVIAERQGIACRFELKEVVLGKMGLTDVLLAHVLGSSPIIERVEHGLYKLRGRRIGDGALASARARLRERSGQANFNEDVKEWIVRITEASQRHEQHHVPELLRPSLAGRIHRVFDAEGALLGEVKVGQAGAMRGLNCLFPDASPGDLFLVKLLEDGIQVTHSVTMETGGADATSQRPAKESGTN